MTDVTHDAQEAAFASASSQASAARSTCLRLIYAAAFWDRIAYHGVLAILIFYLVERGLNGSQASALSGNFAALVFVATLLGATMADAWLGLRRAIVFGVLLMACGCIGLTLSTLRAPSAAPDLLLLAGLGLLIVGGGHVGPSVSNLIGQFAGEQKTRRDTRFSTFWMIQNGGVLIGPLLIGWIAKFGWTYGFLAAAIAMSVAVGLFSLSAEIIRRRPEVLPDLTHRATSMKAVTPTPYLLGLGGVILIGLILQDARIVGVLVMGALMVAISWFLFLAMFRATPVERTRNLLCLYVAGFSFIFLLLLNQYATALALFTAEHIQLTLLGITLQPAQVIFFQPAFLVLLMPLFIWAGESLDRRGQGPSPLAKMAVGLIALSLAFAGLALASHFGEEGVKLSLWWMIGFYFVMAVAEILVAPVSLSLTTQLAVPRTAGLTVALWMLGWALANYLAALGSSAVWTEVQGAAAAGSLARYGRYFALLGLVGVVGGVVLIAVTPRLQRRISTILTTGA